MLSRVNIQVAGSHARESWHAMLALAPRLGEDDWVLIGGQMITIYAAGHQGEVSRETTDADVVMDLRVNPRGLDRAHAALTEAGFEQHFAPGTDIGHRYRRGEATIDILAPEGLGERNPMKLGGGRTLAAIGASRALARAYPVVVEFDGRAERVRIPSPVGALTIKGTALYHGVVGSGRSPARHRSDIITMLACCDLSRDELPLSKSERRIMRRILADRLIPERHRRRLQNWLTPPSIPAVSSATLLGGRLARQRPQPRSKALM